MVSGLRKLTAIRPAAMETQTQNAVRAGTYGPTRIQTRSLVDFTNRDVLGIQVATLYLINIFLKVSLGLCRNRNMLMKCCDLTHII